MKRLLSIILTVAFIALTGCSAAAPAPVAESASATASEQFLMDRLGTSEGFVLGTATDAAAYGIDMTDFRDEGYVIRREGAETLIFGKTEDGLDRGVRYFVKNCKDDGVINVTYGEGYRVKRITIAGRDISEYVIYLAEGADQCHTIAASELQKYIKLACGVELTVVRRPTTPMIALEQLMESDPRSDVLGREGFNISVKDNGNLFITGGRDRGCLYGVYELLEAYIGWRFAVNGDTIDHKVTEDDFYLYDAEHIDIPAGLVDEQIPSFDYRQGRLYAGNYLLWNSDLPIILRENDRIRGSHAYNGYGYGRGACHGFTAVVNSGYLDDLYDYELIQQFKNNSAQPCFTDDDLIDACIAYYSDNIEGRLAAGQEIGKDLVEVDVSMLDNNNFCTCEKCVEYMQLDGSQTGPVLYFCNAITEALTEKYPGLYVSTLIYAMAINPPKVTMPHPALNCSFCYYSSACSNHDLSGDSCTPATNPLNNIITNAHYATALERWCEIAGRVTVWTYPGNWYFNNMCASSIKTLKDDMKYLYDLGIHGIYPCMQDPPYWNTEDALIGYLLDELQWNADITDEEYYDLIEEYFRVFYGADAAPYLMDYIKWEETADLDTCWTFQGWTHPGQRTDFAKVRDDFEYGVALFEKAMSFADTAEQELGILKFSLSLYNTYLIAAHTEKYLNGTETERAEYARVFEYFKENALATGFALDGTVLTEEDFDIELNLARFYDFNYVHDDTDTGLEWWETIK